MHVLIPLSYRDFDATVVTVPWRLLTDRGREVVFSTHSGGATRQWELMLLGGVSFGRFGDEPKLVRA